MSETKMGLAGVVVEEVDRANEQWPRDAAVAFHALAVNSFVQNPVVAYLAKLDIAVVKYLLGGVRQLMGKKTMSTMMAMRMRVEGALGLLVTLDTVKVDDHDEATVAKVKLVLNSQGLLDITSQVVGDVLSYRSTREGEMPGHLVSVDDVYTVLTASQEKAIDDSEADLTIADFVSIVRIAASVIRGVKGREGEKGGR